MVLSIQRSSTIPQERKTDLYTSLYEEDKTDTKVKFKLIIDAMLSTGEERVAIYDSCTKEKLTMSADHLGYTLMGLNDVWCPEGERRALSDKFADQILEIIKNRSMSIAMKFLGNFIPRIDDLAGFEAKLTAAIGHLEAKDKFAQKSLTQQLELLQNIIAARKL